MTVSFELSNSVAIDSLRIPSDGSSAWMVLKRGEQTCAVWFTAETERREWVETHPATYLNQGATFVGQCFYMGHGTFEEIALGLKSSKESGWIGEKAST